MSSRVSFEGIGKPKVQTGTKGVTVPVGCDILVATPSHDGTMNFMTSQSLDIATNVARNEGLRVEQVIWPGSSIAKLRNKLVDVATKARARHILFCDSDMAIPPDAIVKLYKHDMPVVAGLYVSRRKPWLVMAFDYAKGFDSISKPPRFKNIEKWPESGLLKVDAVGTGFLMIHMSVFDKIDKPYFNFWENCDKEVGGEDVYFCHKVRGASVEIVMDTSFKLGHIGEQVFTVDDHKAWMHFVKQSKKQKDAA